mgnify:CR=1 FL=1
MAFYEEFSKYYDDIFKFDSQKLYFLQKMFEEKVAGKILDIGTGTGTYAVKLAKKNYEITGIDLNKNMLKKARQKTKSAKIKKKPSFIELNMKDILHAFESGSFSGAYSIGNVLVHLEDKETIKDVTGDLYQLLGDKGRLVIQIINYERILKQNIKGLPTIINEDENISFIRNYNFKSNSKKIEFHTILKIKDSEQIFENRIELYPLLPDELKQILKDNGFTNIKSYGSFNQDEFEIEESIPFIVTADKE